MLVHKKVKLSPGAWISFSSLPVMDQEQIMATLVELTVQPPEQWPREKVQRLAAAQPLYTLRYLVQPNDELFVTFRLDEEGEFTIVDLSLKEMILRYFSDKKP